MALHKDFPQSPYAILDPGIRWFPADEALRETSMEKLMPPLVAELRRKVKDFRDGGYVTAADTSRSLLNWWFKTPDLSVRDKGFRCFKCGGKGDLLKLIEVAAGLDFPSAVAWLEKETGIRPPDRRKGGYRDKGRAGIVQPGASHDPSAR